MILTEEQKQAITNEYNQFVEVQYAGKTKKERQEVRSCYKNLGIDCEIHYVYVDDETWKQNIAERNKSKNLNKMI